MLQPLVDHNKLWILKEMGIPDHLTCLLWNLYEGQEATVKTVHGTMDWFQIGKRVRQGCILSPCLFNLYAQSIMRNARLNEAQAGIKTAGRNINNLRYAYDTTLLAESKEEIKSLLMKVKEETEKADLKLNIQKKNHDIRSYPLMANGWGKNENSDILYFPGLQNYWGCWPQPWNIFGRKAMTNLDSVLKSNFANKGPYNESYGFSSSHIWM